MKITNEFTVHTPIDRAWDALTDLPGIAPCLPGAQLTGVDGDVYQGKVKVKVGPVISDFNGTARFTEKDDEAYRAVIDAKGRDARAGGNASALVTAVLKPAGDSTLVSVDTDLKISGKLAQFGSGMIKEISGKLLAQFVANLEAKLATDDTAAHLVNGSPTPANPPEGAPTSANSPDGTSMPADPLEGTAAAASSLNGVTAAAAPSMLDGPAPSAAAVDTVPGTAAVVAPGPPAARPGPQAPSPASLTADLIPAEPGAAEPATPAVAGSEPLAASTTTTPDAVTAPPAPAGVGDPGSPPIRDPHEATDGGSRSTAPSGRPAASSGLATASSGRPAGLRSAAPAVQNEPEALDLLAVAGGSLYKRLIPAAVGVVVVVGVVVWLVGRR